LTLKDDNTATARRHGSPSAGHDPDFRAQVPGLMCGVAALQVPLAVDLGAGENWDQAH